MTTHYICSLCISQGNCDKEKAPLKFFGVDFFLKPKETCKDFKRKRK